MDLARHQARQVCSSLDRFGLPSAFVHCQSDSFIAWNDAFLRLTGFREEDLAARKSSDMIQVQKSTSSESLAACSFLGASGQVLNGRLAVNKGGINVLMLDPELIESGAANVAATLKERQRVYELFHDTVAPNLIGAALCVRALRKDFELAATPDQLKNIDMVAEALRSAVYAMMMALTGDDGSSGDHDKDSVRVKLNRSGIPLAEKPGRVGCPPGPMREP